jgi:tetratricopeptide (TPR) repeat protein
MKTELDTASREAFEHYDEAIACVETYRASGNREFVEKSYVHLEAAQTADPRWVKPSYLKSLVKDLAGDPESAIRELEELKDIPDSAFSLEVKLKLGAAHYHRYHEEHLIEAEKLFDEVKTAASASLPLLSLLACSYLAQVYGMRVLLKNPAEKESRKTEAKDWYERCRSEAKKALAGLAEWKDSNEVETERGEGWVAQEIEWAANNALGFSGSFLSDYLSAKERIPLLQRSISSLQRALEIRPNHWASLSNLASASLRLGYTHQLLNDQNEGDRFLNEALHSIDLVLSPEVRPNYAFALYERGRILRLLGQFDKAVASLISASKIPDKLRDVSCGTIASEIVRAATHRTDFPGAPV